MTLLLLVMVLALRFRMHQAVGTSTALMIFTSTGGILAYIYYGLRDAMGGKVILPLYSAGYVNLLQWLFTRGYKHANGTGEGVNCS